MATAKNRDRFQPQICAKPRSKAPRTQVQLPTSIAMKSSKAYREMLLIRRFEEKAGQLYGMGFIGGFCHLYIGQEAVVVGMQMALKEGDQVITGLSRPRPHAGLRHERRAASWRN